MEEREQMPYQPDKSLQYGCYCKLKWCAGARAERALPGNQDLTILEIEYVASPAVRLGRTSLHLRSCLAGTATRAATRSIVPIDQRNTASWPGTAATQ